MQFNRSTLSMILTVILLLVLVTVPTRAQDTTTSPVFWFEDGSEAGEATLTRFEHGIYMTLDTTGLQPDDAVTIWWVIFNTPENCSDGMCGEDDIFNIDENGDFILNDDGSIPLNLDGIEAAQIAIARADGQYNR